jgi:thymidylate synthase
MKETINNDLEIEEELTEMEMEEADYELQYRNLLFDVMENHTIRKDRTGVGCASTFSLGIDINISKRFPILSGRKMFPHIFKSEFKWLLSGETNIKPLQEANNKIWNEWADENGDLGPVYGHQLRNFNSQGYDQLEAVIDSLNKTPDSRRHVISLWNPNQLEEMKLPPCYLYFQFFVEGNKLNMFALQRSADVFLGVPYDIALFAQLLLYISEKTGYNANKLSVKFIDAHIYANQQQAVEEYLEEGFNAAPTYAFQGEELTLNDYEPGKIISAPVAI